MKERTSVNCIRISFVWYSFASVHPFKDVYYLQTFRLVFLQIISSQGHKHFITVNSRTRKSPLHWPIKGRRFYNRTCYIAFRPHKVKFLLVVTMFHSCNLLKSRAGLTRAAFLHCAVVNRKRKNVDLFCRLPQCAFPE